MDHRSIARVIFDALEEQDQFVAGDMENAKLEGDFNLLEVAEKVVAWMSTQNYVACPDCDGTGRIVKNKPGVAELKVCGHCAGSGRIPA